MTYVDAQHLLCVLMKDHPIQCDGIWGPQSKAAMKEFQTKFGIPADGMLTVESGKALRHAVAYWYNEVDASDIIVGDKYGEDINVPSNPSTVWDECPNFEEREFLCKCNLYHEPYCDGKPHEIQPLLVRICQRARNHFGIPIEIVSGLRCPQHNADQPGSAKNSQHMYGEAADVRAVGVDQQTLLNWFLSQPDVRYAYAIEGSQNVHFDIQPVGR